MPLPWGEAQDVAPYALMEHYAPKRLREQEEHERKNAGIRARDEAEFHNACNHIRYRKAHASRWRSRAWANRCPAW
ncbi:hypothetical protein N5D83_04235 [Pseudomonas chengduensis]|nr:hypothetical protein [Pseudomonas chengduensis]MDH1866029.1 hypothetical protein [Pseudomonas chengduensis]